MSGQSIGIVVACVGIAFGMVGTLIGGYLSAHLTRRLSHDQEEEKESHIVTQIRADMRSLSRDVGLLRTDMTGVRDKVAGIEGLLQAREFWKEHSGNG